MNWDFYGDIGLRKELVRIRTTGMYASDGAILVVFIHIIVDD